MARNWSKLRKEGEQEKSFSSKETGRLAKHRSEGGNPMEKPSNKEIWVIDSTLCDLLVYDTLADRASVQDQAEQQSSRTQLICSIDPNSRLVIACRLSYEEEETLSEH